MPDFGLGRIEATDDRDQNYPVQLALDTAEIDPDLRERYWPHEQSLDQGDTGTCVGHAWAHFAIDGPIVNAEVDPIEIYCRATELDPWTENDPFTDRGGTLQCDQQFGTSVRAGAKALQERGILETYLWAFTVEEIVQTLLHVGPVVVGSDWHSSMFGTDGNDHLWLNGQVVGGHAYVLNGIDLDANHVRVKNSWGSRWGVDGTAWLYLWDLAALISAGAEACMATELEVVLEDPDDDRPSGNATTEEWYAYRLAQGYTPAELEGLGRNDMRDDLEDRTPDPNAPTIE